MNKIINAKRSPAWAKMSRRFTLATSFKIPTANKYQPRHIGPREHEQEEMLQNCGVSSIKELMDETIPQHLRRGRELDLPEEGIGEREALLEIEAMMGRNRLFRSHIGLGYYPCVTPAVIQRCMFENPTWYTPYTPYQFEIAQGRLEMLLNFQTMICELTGMEIANASLLDEAVAAAEALTLCWNAAKHNRKEVLIASHCFPQTIDVCVTRLGPIGMKVSVVDDIEASLNENVCGVLIQNPQRDGHVTDCSELISKIHNSGAKCVIATDLLASTIIKPPGEMGADLVVGSNQRFGIPMGFGGPHAGFLASREAFKRMLPGRLIGVSKDSRGKKAYRLSLQVREQHIRRDKATSNICTAQALLANMSAAFAIYHGPEGLQEIGERVHQCAVFLAEGLRQMGLAVPQEKFFDTITVQVPSASAILEEALGREINLRLVNDKEVAISLDETTTEDHIQDLFNIFTDVTGREAPAAVAAASPLAPLRRAGPCLAHPIFHQNRSETAMMRYLYKLEKRDLSLNTAGILMGSCTMKLNSATALLPVSWPSVNQLHPFVPAEQRKGYDELITSLERALAEITGFHAISLQPNAGSAGEYAGLMCIRSYHHSRGEPGRDVCLIPTSAHGTNPASAAFAGFRIVVVRCGADGSIDMQDFQKKADLHASNLGALMITYPSTHGVFEDDIKKVCQMVHERGGQVYMDGANLQAQVGYCTPDGIGADVAHLNLHKTFCIPHGGGGPGLGPIGVREHLAPFLPNHCLIPTGGEESYGPVAAAPWSSASLLPIPYVYIRMMGAKGLKNVTEAAILNANYMVSKLRSHYSILYTGAQDRCAHEFIIDLRPFRIHGIKEEDVAKRLMDFNLHAPTMSWPVVGTIMFEPTESEPKEEMDRMCDAMIKIRAELQDVVDGKIAIEDSPLRHAPHTADQVADPSWDRAYTQYDAAYPLASNFENKYWPYVSRIDNVYGDKHVFCRCPPPEMFD